MKSIICLLFLLGVLSCGKKKNKQHPKVVLPTMPTPSSGNPQIPYKVDETQLAPILNEKDVEKLPVQMDQAKAEPIKWPSTESVKTFILKKSIPSDILKDKKNAADYVYDQKTLSACVKKSINKIKEDIKPGLNKAYIALETRVDGFNQLILVTQKEKKQAYETTSFLLNLDPCEITVINFHQQSLDQDFFSHQNAVVPQEVKQDLIKVKAHFKASLYQSIDIRMLYPNHFYSLGFLKKGVLKVPLLVESIYFPKNLTKSIFRMIPLKSKYKVKCKKYKKLKGFTPCFLKKKLLRVF
jgi:hypothetical protein